MDVLSCKAEDAAIILRRTRDCTPNDKHWPLPPKHVAPVRWVKSTHGEIAKNDVSHPADWGPSLRPEGLDVRNVM